jgi:hypothetical protein
LLTKGNPLKPGQTASESNGARAIAQWAWRRGRAIRECPETDEGRVVRIAAASWGVREREGYSGKQHVGSKSDKQAEGAIVGGRAGICRGGFYLLVGFAFTRRFTSGDKHQHLGPVVETRPQPIPWRPGPSRPSRLRVFLTCIRHETIRAPRLLRCAYCFKGIRTAARAVVPARPWLSSPSS